VGLTPEHPRNREPKDGLDSAGWQSWFEHLQHQRHWLFVVRRSGAFAQGLAEGNTLFAYLFPFFIPFFCFQLCFAEVQDFLGPNCRLKCLRCSGAIALLQQICFGPSFRLMHRKRASYGALALRASSRSTFLQLQEFFSRRVIKMWQTIDMTV